MAEFIPNGVAPDPFRGSPNHHPISEAPEYRSPNATSAPGYGSPNGVGSDYSSPNMEHGPVEFNPSQLGLYGWYDINTKSSLFQDASGTLPVTTVGQLIGSIQDLSGSGHHLVQTGLAAVQLPTEPTVPYGAGKPVYSAISDVLGMDTNPYFRLKYSNIWTEDLIWKGSTGYYNLAVSTTSGVQFYRAYITTDFAFPKNQFIECFVRIAPFTIQEKSDITAWLNAKRIGIPDKQLILECNASSYIGRGGYAEGTYEYLFGSGASYTTPFTDEQPTTPPEVFTYNADQVTGWWSNNFQNNSLAGTLPVLTGYVNLWQLNATANQLTGCIPSLLTNIGLANLTCDSNFLTGEVPSLSACVELIQVYFIDNKLSGSLPDLTNNTKLKYFLAHFNEFSGSIPDLTTNIALESFSVSGNKLTGRIPSLSNNVMLGWFQCYSNELTDFVGGVPPSLESFSAANNLLTTTAINNILAAFVAANRITATGELDLGGSGNAAPTGQGLTDKTTLISRGWTVTTN